MNREITKRLLDGFDKLCPHNMSRGPGPICDECWVIWGAEEIERLLAQERESMECGHPRACWVELKAEAPDGSMQGYAAECSACAEREKVREMCAKAAWNFMTGGWMCDAEDVADEIRQLDLTKELAGSSAEEGGDAK